MPDSMIVVHSSTLKRCLWKSSITCSSSRSGIWPWAMPMRASGTSSLELALHAADALDVVVQEIHLAAARQLALERLAQQRVVPGHDEGLHREAMRRRRGDDRQVAQAGHRHVQRARDRRRGERQQVRRSARSAFSASFWRTPKRCSSSTMTRPRSLNFTSGCSRRWVPTMTSILPSASFASSALISFVGLEARQHLDPDRPVGEAVARSCGSAARRAAWSAPAPRPACRRWRRRRRRAPRPRSCRSRRRRRPRGPSAAWRGEVADHRFDRGVLVGRFLEREAAGERLVHRAVDGNDASPARACALGLDLEQFGGDVADLFGGLALAPWSRLAAERMQRRGFRRGAGIAADQVQLRDRHVQAVALGVLDRRGIRPACRRRRA